MGRRVSHEVALEGDLARFGAGDVLQWMGWAQATGRVEFRRAGETIGLLLEGGRLVQARTNGRSVRTGDVLIHRGLVEPERLAVALSDQRQHGGRLGERLVADGAADSEAVRRAVQECLSRVVYRLLLWKEGSFRFDPDAHADGGSLPVELDLEPLILDGLRIADSVATTS